MATHSLEQRACDTLVKMRDGCIEKSAALICLASPFLSFDGAAVIARASAFGAEVLAVALGVAVVRQ